MKLLKHEIIAIGVLGSYKTINGVKTIRLQQIDLDILKLRAAIAMKLIGKKKLNNQHNINKYIKIVKATKKVFGKIGYDLYPRSS